MRKISYIAAVALALFAAACTPKAGEKVVQKPVGAAPSIPMPSGDVRKEAPKAGAAPTIQIGKAETFQLENGLRVILVENHKLPRVSFQIFVDNDPVMEKNAAGYLDLMGELLSKGTLNRSKSQIDEEVDYIGASLSTNANGVNGACLSKYSEKMLDLMSDVLLRPTFPKDEFEKAKTRTLSGLAQSKEDANTIAANVGSRLRYGKNHPYGEFATEETIKNVTPDQIKQHYATYFKPNIAYFVVVGDITRAKTEQYAKKYFGKWERSESVPKSQYVLPRPPEKTQVEFVHKAGAVQSVVNITYPVELMPGTADAIRGRLMNTILGGYFNSRVNANLREGHGWTYGARTTLRPDELVGSFIANASVRNAVTDSSIIEFMKEMELLRTEKVKNSELQVVKNVLTGQFSQSLEEPGTVAEFALTTARLNLPADYYEKYLSNLQAVTPEEVLLTAKKYIRPDRAHILVVGNRDDVADRLKQFDTDGKIDFLDAWANPVKTINTNLPPGMTAEKVIEDYLQAIGGKANIAAIQNVQTTAVMKTRGMEITIVEAKKDGAKLSQEMLMNGQSMGKTIMSDGKARQTGVGGAARDVEGVELADLKEQALAVKEAAYSAYKLTLKGIDEIEGKAAYIIEVERPGGKKSTEYYDVTTSLKLREVSIDTGADGQMKTLINDFSDFREVNGVKFPFEALSTGIFPTPVKIVVSDLKVNAGVPDDVFMIK